MVVVEGLMFVVLMMASQHWRCLDLQLWHGHVYRLFEQEEGVSE